jgi:S1-C subfamily serine protease
LQHLKELARVANDAAPDSDSKRKLNVRLSAAVKAGMEFAISAEDLPKNTRDAAIKIAKTEQVDDLLKQIEDHAHPDLVSPNLVPAGASLSDTIIRVQQVLETTLPTFSAIASGPNAGFVRVPACPANQRSFYPKLTNVVLSHMGTLTPLMDSVGRIEIKQGTSAPNLVGTAFVVDQHGGLVVTACHVVTDIASFHPETNQWVLQANAWLDFGKTDAHDPQREFRVIGVAFLPNVVGCDGAVLRVDTTSRQLPPALDLATSEPNVPKGGILSVSSIGYPSRDLSDATQATRDYFTCVRASTADTAKFLFAGEVTADEPKSTYHILAHVVPTAGGQSGSPLLDLTDPDHPHVIGIHICCVKSEPARIQEGNPCMWRDEPFMEEAVSVVDLMRLYRGSGTHAERPLPERTNDGIPFLGPTQLILARLTLEQPTTACGRQR